MLEMEKILCDSGKAAMIHYKADDNEKGIGYRIVDIERAGIAAFLNVADIHGYPCPKITMAPLQEP